MTIVLNVLVVDDEAPARDELKYLLSREDGITVAGEADSGPTAIAKAAEIKPQVIFLDVQMRGMSGCEAAVVLRTVVPEALVVFATAYDDYAVKAFEIGAVDYILKPFEGERVHATVERLKNYHPGEWQAAGVRVDAALREKLVVHKLPVLEQGKIVLVDYEQVIFAHVHTGMVQVVADNGHYTYNGSLSELADRTAGSGLVRVHKSYVVNMNRVREVIPWFKGTYWLKMADAAHTEIPVSKSQIKEVKEILGL